jgi:hypothetical protein
VLPVFSRVLEVAFIHRCRLHQLASPALIAGNDDSR